MHSDFGIEYKKLNQQQKLAVDHLDGPLLVIAGPGTGKTQLLSLRAANILKKTDASPQNILCLTFTISGSQEMKNRLISLIGDEAYNISVSTYHSFGSEIIQQNPWYFEGNNLSAINKLKIDIIIRDIQKALPFNSAFKHSNQVYRLSSLISDFKKSLLTPSDLVKTAEANISFINDISIKTIKLTKELSRVSLKSIEQLESLLVDTNKKLPVDSIESYANVWNNELQAAINEALESSKARSLSKWKARYLTKNNDDKFIAKGLEKNNRLIETAGIYKKYVDYLKNHNLYDFDDMIILSIDTLKEHNNLRYSLQEQYQYIMLDEYQDTNKAQAELINLLTDNEANEGRPNVMAVGDDDQAIYAFQGAKHSNLVDFANQYTDTKVISLQISYRSPQNIIDLSSAIGQQIKDRLVAQIETASRDIIAASQYSGSIESYNFTNEVDQYIWLSEKVKSNDNGSIAIISPEHKYLERAASYLISKDVRFNYDRKENVLDNIYIHKITTIIRALMAINQKNKLLINSLLAEILTYDFWQLETNEVINISWNAYDNRKPWLETIIKNPKAKDIALMLIKLSSNALIYRFDFIIDQIIGLSDIVVQDQGPRSLRSPFLEYYSERDKNFQQHELYQNLMILRDQCKDFNLDNSQPILIDGLIDFADQLNLSGTKLINTYSITNSDSDINLLTAHGAKGLEFDTTYLISMISEAWGTKTSSNIFSLPENLEFIKSKADDSEDESLRLLYVALSRAKKKVITLSYDQDVQNKSTTPLKYLNQNSIQVKLNNSRDLKPLWLNEEKPGPVNDSLKQLLNNRLENYSLSPTDLNTFLDIRNAGPQSFYKTALLKYSSPVPAKVDYGNAIHESLNWLQSTFYLKKKLPLLSQLIIEFEKYLQAKRLTSEDFEQLKKQGTDVLSLYYNSNKNSFSLNDMSEYSFGGKRVTLDKVRLTGKVDKLVLNPNVNKLVIVDYKTGKGYKKWQNQPKLHLYKNQLYFYKLLVDQSGSFKDYVVDEAVLDFLEPLSELDKPITLQLIYTKIEMERFVKLIKAVWKHINNLDFPDVSNYAPNLKGINSFEDDLIAGNI